MYTSSTFKSLVLAFSFGFLARLSTICLLTLYILFFRPDIGLQIPTYLAEKKLQINTDVTPFYLVSTLILAPVFENLVLLVWEIRSKVTAIVAGVSVIGFNYWVHHLAGNYGLSGAFFFAVLLGIYVFFRQKHSVGFAYAMTAVAHFSGNLYPVVFSLN